MKDAHPFQIIPSVDRSGLFFIIRNNGQEVWVKTVPAGIVSHSHFITLDERIAIINLTHNKKIDD